MHILFITYYYEPDLGAASVRLSRLAKLLHQRGHQITVLTTMPHYPQGHIQDEYQGKWFTDENRDGIRVIQVWLWATPERSIVRRLLSQLSFVILAILRGVFLPQPDVIFLENQPIPVGVAGWLMSRIKRRRYLLNVSDYWPEYLLITGTLSESSILYRIFKFFVNLTQRQAGAIVALYPGLLNSIEARIGHVDNSAVIMNAVDLQKFRPDLDTTAFRQKYALGNAKLITFVGTLGYHLDLDAMLATAAAFESRDDVYFLIIGTGIYRDVIEENARKYQRLKWIGLLDQDEIPYAWAASYLTYWAEYDTELTRQIFRAKFFEAMASGVPCVVAVEGIFSDVLEQNHMGKTVSFGNTPALISAIDHLLNHEDERMIMGKQARQYAQTHFDVEAVASTYETMLKSI